jgi:hypothetical protein
LRKPNLWQCLAEFSKKHGQYTDGRQKIKGSQAIGSLLTRMFSMISLVAGGLQPSELFSPPV